MTDHPIEMNQENKLGSKSTQIAKQNNYYGMDYHDTKELCHDLIKHELKIYKDEAEQEARKRYEDFSSAFLKKLEQENITDQIMCKEFKNPDMQYTYLEAQKAYMRLGTPELETMLSNMLVDRVKEQKHSLLQIVLAEAITVVPTLLPEQLDILALCFRLRYSLNKYVNSLDSLISYINTQVMPHVCDVKYKLSLFQHLVYTKAGSIDIGEASLETIMSHSYGGLFLSGYSQAELGDFPQRFPSLFRSCIHDSSKIQINETGIEELNKFLDSRNDISDDDKKYICEHFSNNLMLPNKIKECILEKAPNLKDLFQIWNDTSLKNLTLTSVGILLGANRCKQITGQQFDMNIWI